MDIRSTYSGGYSSRRSSGRTTQSSAGSSSSGAAHERGNRETTPDIFSEIINSPLERLSSGSSSSRSLGSLFSGENFRTIEDEQVPPSNIGYGHTTESSTTSKREAPPSGYSGVYWNKRTKIWEAQDRYQGRTVLIGRYNSAEEAFNELEKVRSSRASSYKDVNVTGVSWNKSTNKWVAKYKYQGTRIYVGNYDSWDKAKQALDEDRRNRNAPEIGTSKYGPRKRRAE